MCALAGFVRNLGRFHRAAQAERSRARGCLTSALRESLKNLSRWPMRAVHKARNIGIRRVTCCWRPSFPCKVIEIQSVGIIGFDAIAASTDRGQSHSRTSDVHIILRATRARFSAHDLARLFQCPSFKSSMTTTLRLTKGELLGRALARHVTEGLTLTLTAYPAGRSYARHVHEQATLFVLFAGNHRDETKSGAIDQPPLSIVFHPHDAPHGTVIGATGVIGLNVELTGEWLEARGFRPRDLTSDCRLLDSHWDRILGTRLAVLADEPGDMVAADVETAILELIASLAAPPRTSCRPAWIPRAIEYLQAHLNTPVSLRDLAADVGVHPAYCARAFRCAIGCTVSAYIRALRLAAAGELVFSDGLPLAEAALAAGFADQAHFTRTSSCQLGFTPGRLKRARQSLLSRAPG
jgi:AraC family transcriptional regulator